MKDWNKNKTYEPKSVYKDLYKSDKKDDPTSGSMKKKMTTKDIIKSFSVDLDNATQRLSDILKRDHRGWDSHSTRLKRNIRTGEYTSTGIKNREGKYQARIRALSKDGDRKVNNVFLSETPSLYDEFSIGSGIKQSTIGIIPIYGKYNKYKKKKALYAANKYKGIIGANDNYTDFRIGDDFSDLKKDIAVKLFGTHKDLSPEQKRMVKAYLKRLMGGETIDVTRMQGVNVN